MARTVALAVILSIVPIAMPGPASAAGDTCTPWHGIGRPPSHVRIFMIHRRGSPIPAHIDRVPFRLYVERVMASGAWPARLPWASLQVGAIAIRQYASWMIAHHQRGYDFHGRCYDLRQGDQYYQPGVPVRRRLVDAVASTWGVWLKKGGRLFRTGWRGNAGRDGWHIHEEDASRMARAGYGWRHIIEQQLAPVQVLLA